MNGLDNISFFVATILRTGARLSGVRRTPAAQILNRRQIQFRRCHGGGEGFGFLEQIEMLGKTDGGFSGPFRWITFRFRTVLLFALLLLGSLGHNSSAAENSTNSYYELRIYDVSSNKLDAVMERFRETVEPLRKKHAIETKGYWTSTTTNGQKFVYLLAASSREELQAREKEFGVDPAFKKGYAASNAKHGKTVEKIVSMPLIPGLGEKLHFETASHARIFDLRIYSILPGKMEAFQTRWKEHAIPIYARHGLKSLAWWESMDRDSSGNGLFVCLLAGESEQEIQKSITAFHQDAEWLRVEKETETNGKLRASVIAYKLAPTDFSPLK